MKKKLKKKTNLNSVHELLMSWGKYWKNHGNYLRKPSKNIGKQLSKKTM